MGAADGVCRGARRGAGRPGLGLSGQGLRGEGVHVGLLVVGLVVVAEQVQGAMDGQVRQLMVQ